METMVADVVGPEKDPRMTLSPYSLNSDRPASFSFDFGHVQRLLLFRRFTGPSLANSVLLVRPATSQQSDVVLRFLRDYSFGVGKPESDKCSLLGGAFLFLTRGHLQICRTLFSVGLDPFSKQ
jgi:hypothetical protein